MPPLREISLLADSKIRWLFAYSLVVDLNDNDVIMAVFFSKVPSIVTNQGEQAEELFINEA